MTHPNAMVAWDEIACQRSHDHHAMSVEVMLGSPPATPHGYFDYPQVPARFARQFSMMVWDPQRHPVDGGPYCPAHDAVSETIVSHRIWEPRETILALQVLSTAPEGSWMLDMGAQLGWYSWLALSSGVPVIAWEADPDNARMLEATATLNNWGSRLLTGEDISSMRRVHLEVFNERIGPDSPSTDASGFPGGIRFVKMDLEGAENMAVGMLRPALDAGRIDHILMEVSPCFADYYPDLVVGLIESGYRAYMLPEKHQPPWPLDDLPADLEEWRLDGHADVQAFVASWQQEDIWLAREGATW